MNHLTKQALSGFTQFQLLLALMFFLPAWSLRYWEAWVYWLLFGLSALLNTLYFLKYDPSLVASRLAVGPGAAKENREKVIQTLASIFVGALFIIPGFDHRFHWSAVPRPYIGLGDALVVLAFLIFFLVFKENSYASAI